MTAKKLTRVSLIFSIMGITLIIFLSIFSEPKKILIEDINKNLLDSYVKIQGTVINIEKIRSHESCFLIIRLKDSSGSIDILDYENSDLRLNQNIQVIGKVSEYKNEIQIESKKIGLEND